MRASCGNKIILIGVVALMGIIFFAERLVRGDATLSQTVCNPGIAFGVYIPQAILFSMVGVWIGMGILWIRKNWISASALQSIAAVVIMSGALSNVIDRMMYGCVMDYIVLQERLVWFNLADICIVCGSVVFVWEYVFTRERF